MYDLYNILLKRSDQKMKVRVEFVNEKAIEKFTNIVKTVKEDVRLIGKDENGCDWNLSAKSLLGSLVLTQKMQKAREHTAHDVDWNTTWVECEKDIYQLIEEFIIVGENTSIDK